jgi:DNA-binding IclR family transcriptional regulator
VRSRPARAPARSEGRETAELTLRLLEFLACERGPFGITELAQIFDTSKATVYRHLRTLARREFVRQDPLTQRYEPGIRLFQLAQGLRERFDILGAARQEMLALREASGQAVTLTTLAQDRLMVLDLVQGHSVIEFGVRPGTQLELPGSAHGKVALAFGPARFREACLRQPPPAAGGAARLDPAKLERQLQLVRRQGWATAANEVAFGVNALAAPVFDHRGDLAGAIAIVGSTQFIAARPAAAQIAMVTAAAGRISEHLGWRAP